jgi:carboxylesterase type B
MQNYLIAFANGGNPNSSAPQRWPEYTSNQRSILRLSIPERRDVWPNADRIKKLAEIPPR